ncbi:MAG: sigma-54-dependent Fis family transcriptional regulator [Mangrovicoccus sp.]|nr:sigma-54-dependent Fis family transcriptional regulator [Mangrovicoccus sp.]
MRPWACHVDRVLSTAQSSSAAAHSRLAASWRRSVFKHGLDPADRRAPARIEAPALHRRRAELDQFLAVATRQIDSLFQLVASSGCCVLLTDAEGVILDQRCDPGDAAVFRHWGLCEGAVWSEAVQGTNGIGTCLAESRAITIHREDHFYARNTGMSCMDAPIFGADGQILAALDVSSARPEQTEAFNRLIAAMVVRTARAIEADNFRATYRGARIVIAEDHDADAAVLLAIDQDDLVIGATREARRVFGLGDKARITPRPAADLLGRGDGPAGFEKAERAAVIRALARSGGNVTQAARALGVGRATLYRRMNRLGIGDSRP